MAFRIRKNRKGGHKAPKQGKDVSPRNDKEELNGMLSPSLLGNLREVNPTSTPSMRNNEVIFGRMDRFAALSAGIHALSAIVTDGLKRDRIEPLRPTNDKPTADTHVELW